MRDADKAVIDALKVQNFGQPPGNLEQLRGALAADGSPDVVDADGFTALHLSLMTQGSACTEALLAAGAKMEVKDMVGQTPLYSAASWSNEEAAFLLLDRGADPSARPDCRPSLFLEACFYGLWQLVDRLIAKGADPNETVPAGGFAGQTAIARAVYAYGSRPEQNKIVIEHLLAAGAKVDAKARALAAKVKGEHGRQLAALLGAPPPKKRVVKPEELGEFKHPLFRRLRAYLEIFAKRPDIEVRVPLAIGTTPCRELDEPYPSDAVSFAQSATDVAFSYRVRADPEAQGYVYLSLAGIGDDPAFLDDAELDECYEFDCDREGVGCAAWFRIKGGKSHILWSIEDGIRFKTFTEYVTKGAKRGFGIRWQDAKSKQADAVLLANSLPTKTPADAVRAGLVERGATPAMADDLIAWLGDRAVILLPK